MKADTALPTRASSGVGDGPLAIAGLNRILALQRTAFLRDGSPSLAERRADLNALRSALVARRHAIEDALNADFGHHSRHETAIMEVVAVAEGIKYLRRNLRAFMRPTRRHVALHMRFGKARVEYQPLGVVGVSRLKDVNAAELFLGFRRENRQQSQFFVATPSAAL